MSISTIEIQPTLAERISIDDEVLTIDFVDGRSISVPLERAFTLDGMEKLLDIVSVSLQNRWR